MGTIAEFVAVNSELVKKPTNSSFEEAAGLPLVGLTSIQALESVGIKDRVLIHAGSGGVGSFAIQNAKGAMYILLQQKCRLGQSFRC
jgi:NADPH:quinone reductase-like Zn-dependent oxidoreductase